MLEGLLQTGQKRMLDQSDQGALRLRAVPGVGADDGSVRSDLQRLPHLLGTVGLVSVESVQGDDERQTAVLEVVHGRKAVRKTPGVDQDDRADEIGRASCRERGEHAAGGGTV